MGTKKPDPEPAAPAVPKPGPDEHAGQGGSYVLDPVTRRRTLVERTGFVPPASQPSPAQE